jgi:hypothetical protein
MSSDTPSADKSASLSIIGWREWLALPELGIPGIKAKVDTGARTSALHTHDFEIYTSGGEERVRFHLHPLRGNEEIELECDSAVTSVREVKDSGGHVEKRPFIQTIARLGNHEWPIDLSLTNRENMRFRMLLGRTAMRKQFAVDPSRSCVTGRALSRVYRALKTPE